MDEVSNPGAAVEETQLQQESAAPQAESAQEALAEGSQVQAKSSPDQHDKSWIKKLRRERDELVRKSQMQEELLKQLMTNQAQAVKPQEPDEDILSQIQKEEYVPGDKVAKALQRQKEDFRKELDQLKKQQEQHFVARQEAEIKATYQDFDDVVNPETLDLLKETNPRLAQRIANLLKVDPMDGAVFAYETISAAGILDKVPGERRAKEVEKRLDQNKKTIQSPSSFDKRPMAQAFRLPETKKEKEALWAETIKYASMSGGGY